jgi:hypothetical protein
VGTEDPGNPNCRVDVVVVVVIMVENYSDRSWSREKKAFLQKGFAQHTSGGWKKQTVRYY